MTNRDWLNSLTNKQLAEFLTYGLYIHDLNEIYNNLPEIMRNQNRTVNLKQITMRYIQSHIGVEQWLNSPQDFEVIPEKE